MINTKTMSDNKRIWLYNPNLPEGDIIDGVFCDARVYLGLRETRSFPIDVGTELKNRYPFLSIVINHPAAEGKLPDPPTGIVEEPKVETPSATVIEPETPAPVIPEEETKIDEMVTCPTCSRVFGSAHGLKIHSNIHKK